MEKITLEDLIKITGGELLQKGAVEYIGDAVIDSRSVKENDLFIPIRGEKVDGHDYIGIAAENGCAVTLTEEKKDSWPKNINVLYVESCLTAMKNIAKFNRKRSESKVIAITGSSGKTTTKDLVASVLSVKYKTMKTQGNFNNEYGVPQTLFRLNSDDEMAVIEMGMDHLGDIRKSIDEVEPNIAIITNIGTAHIEILKTQDNILKAKIEMLETMGTDDIALLNGDDVYLNKIDASMVPYKIARVGIESDGLDLKAEDVISNENGVAFKIQDECYHFAYPGIHNVYNCMVSIWVGKHYGLSAEEIQQGLNHFRPSGNRMDITEIRRIKIINDSYNANPDAMKAALNMLDDMGTGYKRKIAVLGDMLELGDTAEKGHLEIGDYASKKTDVIVGVGERASKYLEGASKKVSCYLYPDAETAGEFLKTFLQPEDIVLIKASRGIHLEKTLKIIEEGK